MSTTATEPKKSKIPPQTDVRIRGGQTTVRVLKSGRLTLDRFDAFLEELTSPAVGEGLRAAVAKCQSALVQLNGELPF